MHNSRAIALVLALVVFGATVLSHVPKGLTAFSDREVGQVTNLISETSTDSNAVQVDGIRFELLMRERVLTIPANQRFVDTPVEIGIRITNTTPTPFRFAQFQAIWAEIVGQDGYHALDGFESRARGRLPKESDYPITLPGHSTTFLLTGGLAWSDNKLYLSVGDVFGGACFFSSLKPGKYKLRIHYNSGSSSRFVYDLTTNTFKEIKSFWMGEGVTPFKEIYLVQP